MEENGSLQDQLNEAEGRANGVQSASIDSVIAEELGMLSHSRVSGVQSASIDSVIAEELGLLSHSRVSGTQSTSMDSVIAEELGMFVITEQGQWCTVRLHRQCHSRGTRSVCYHRAGQMVYSLPP